MLPCMWSPVAWTVAQWDWLSMYAVTIDNAEVVTIEPDAHK